jgi:hypothetical protein
VTSRPAWSEQAIRALGTRTDIPTAGAIIAGLGRAESYRAAADGRLPVVILRVGRRQVVTVASVLTALGLDSPGPGGPRQDDGHERSGEVEQPGSGTAAPGNVVPIRGAGP